MAADAACIAVAAHAAAVHTGVRAAGIVGVAVVGVAVVAMGAADSSKLHLQQAGRSRQLRPRACTHPERESLSARQHPK